MSKATDRKEQKKVDDWNRKYAVGQEVIITKDDLSEINSVTTHPAEILCGTAVCWFEGIRGAYMLERARVK